MKNKTIIPWVSIGVALASAVGIYFLPEYQLWFLSILLLNLLASFVFGKKYDNAALTVCRLLVGALFIFSSFTKGVDPLGTKYKMLDYLAVYGMTWLNDFALALAMLMILAEFIVGICLITKVFPRLAVLGATILMLFFTITTLFDALYDLVPDCGCFGTAIKMSNWQTFYKNLVIDAVLIPLIFNNKRLISRFSVSTQFIIGCLYAFAFLGFEIYNYRHLPVVDFMNWKDPWNDSVWMSQWEFVDQRVEGGANFLGFSALDEEGNDVTENILTTENLLMFTSHDLTKVTEKEWEKIRKITETAEKQDFTVIWTVADEPEYVEKLREKYDFLYEVYYADELEIKPIVRSNPGLIWLDNGLVKDKWSSVDFKKALKVL